MRKKINKFLFLIILSFFIFPLSGMADEKLVDSEVNSTGGANVDGGSFGNVDPTKSQGYFHGEDYAGVRITIVDEDGEKIKGTRSVDYYYYSMFYGGNKTLYRLTGDAYRTGRINDSTTNSDSYNGMSLKKYAYLSGGKIYSNDSNVVVYKNDPLKGQISLKSNWANVNNVLEGILKENVEKYERCEDVVNNTFFFKDTKYNPCKDENFDCKQIEKTYILVEPLLLVNLNQKEIIITAADADYLHTNYYDYFPDLKDHADGTSGVLSVHAYGSMFFNQEGTDYKLNSDDIVYSYFQDNVTPTNRTVYKGCIYKKCDTGNKVIGNGMQAVWLKKVIDRCKETCAYDPLNPDFLIECCDDVDYLDEYFAVNGPGEFIEACCEIPAYLNEYSTLVGTPAKTLYKEYCEEPTDGSCNYVVHDPKFELQVCNDGDDNNTSVFMDPLYADGTLKKDQNVNLSQIIDTSLVYEGYNVPSVRGFTALAYSNDADVYIDTAWSDSYCTTYCQEYLEITLPDNYPYVQAGRYFYWDINGIEHHIVETKGERICAHNIDLERWLTAYKEAASDCQEAGIALAACEDKLVGGSKNCIVEAENALHSCRTGNAHIYKNNANLISEKVGSEEYQEQRETIYRDIALSMGVDVSNPDLQAGYERDYQLYISLGESEEEARNTAAWNWYGVTGSTLDEIEQKTDDKLAEKAENELSNNPESGYEVDPCTSYEDALDEITQQTVTYRSCIGEDQYGNKTIPILENHVNNLKSCFPEDWKQEDVNNSNDIFTDDANEELINKYDVDLFIDYGYETLVGGEKYFSTDYEITEVSNLSDDSNQVETIASQCYYVEEKENVYGPDLISNPCNPNTVFITKDDICGNRPDYYDPYKYVLKYFPTRKSSESKYNYEKGQYEDVVSYGYLGKYGGEVYTLPSYNISNGCSNYEENNNNYYYGYKNYSCITGWSVETENLSDYWKTVYVTREKIDDYYVLNDTINACVCKDGEILDLTDEECTCKKVTDYNVIADESTENTCYFEWESTTSYVNLKEYGLGGNFSVEFMNPSGLYPLYLNYGNIGFNGHFSELLQNNFEQKCPDGVCEYSTEENRCEFVINNKIINDGGKIEDAICPTDDCDNVCEDGDCSDFCEDGDCPRPIEEDIAIGGPELIYRVIDLDNPFPGSDAEDNDDSRSPGTNWNSSIDGVDLVEEYITNNRGVKGNALYSSKLEPFYSFTLTPASIKEIRKFNAANPDYASQGTMIFDNGTITGGVSYVLRDTLRNMIVSPTGNEGYFTINFGDDPRFDDINNNDIVGSDGTLNTCRDAFSGVSE